MPGVSTAGGLVGVLSMVTGMLVSFRLSSSYDRVRFPFPSFFPSFSPLLRSFRSSLPSFSSTDTLSITTPQWYEGRRTWASIQSTTRNLLRVLIFALPAPSGVPSAQDTERDTAMRELTSLVCAFPFACMFRLRDSPGVSHPELRNLLPPALLAAYSSTPSSARDTRRPSLDSSRSSISFVDSSSASESERAIASLNSPPSAGRYRPRSLPNGEPSNLPLSLIRATHAYLNAFHETPMESRDSVDKTTPALDGATWATCIGALKEWSDQLTALERIRDSAFQLFLLFFVQCD